MNSRFQNIHNKGFTLIEIIASIALLVMVIAVLLPVFPQIMSWTKKSNDELVASNLLDQIAYDIKNSEDIKAFDKQYTINSVVYVPKIQFSQTEKEKELGLYRTHIEIFLQRDNKLVSDTYVYVLHKGNADE